MALFQYRAADQTGKVIEGVMEAEAERGVVLRLREMGCVLLRIALPNDDFLLRFRGAVAWAKFELPKAPGNSPQYRAGVEFTDGDAAAIDSVINRNRTS